MIVKSPLVGNKKNENFILGLFYKMHIVLKPRSMRFDPDLVPKARAAKLCSGKAAEFNSAAEFDNANFATLRNYAIFPRADIVISLTNLYLVTKVPVGIPMGINVVQFLNEQSASRF